MILLTDLDFSLPLNNPVIIFSLVLFIILFAPILLKKIKVPHIIGLILAGVAVGPYAFNLLRRDSSIVLFGTVGLLYIMFLAGLEIDLKEFKKNKLKIAVFGITTFLLPFVLGSLASYYILGYSKLSSILLAAMFSTHTLVSYPIASKYGVSQNRAVAITVGGTLITDVFALLILAIVVGMTRGEVSATYWFTLGISTIVFVAIVFFIFPLIIQWFFKKNQDSISQYIFVLAIVFLASFLAEAAGLEAIIGAFFAGLVLNKFVPHSSALMNRIDFVGNALFIPFFLIGVGMLVNFNILFLGWGALKVVGVIAVIAIATKYFAAWITKKSFQLSSEEGKMIFGLSTSRAAATLAIVLVGYNIIIGETPDGLPIRLLDEDVLNGTILLILISCAISSFVVEKAAHRLALKEAEEAGEKEDTGEKILISLAYPDTVSELIDFGLMLKPKKSNVPVYVLNIISDDSNNETAQFNRKKMMDNAIKQAAATEDHIIPLIRYDVNISNGIIYTIKERNITDVLIGLHKDSNQIEFFGPVTENLLSKSWETIFIYKSIQPFNTLKRMIIAVTANAELEPGFNHWFNRISTIAKAGGLPVHFFANDLTIEELKKFNSQSSNPVVASYSAFSHWEDFLIMSRELKQNDFFVIVSSRKGHISYNENLEKVPYYLTKYFTNNSYIIIYPKQLESDQVLNEKDHSDNFILEAIADKVQVVNKAGSYISRMFKKKK
jgi:Kef-type K+ transport system membrane component KefB